MSVTVTVNTSSVIATNNLRLGIQPDHSNVSQFLNTPAYGNYLKEANIKIVRVFDARNRGVCPCTNWNDATKTGTFNWTIADQYVAKCVAIGAEPMFTLGYAGNWDLLPVGMGINPTTGLPYNDSWAAYCREWVKHFGNTVIYYEIMNEPFGYMGWTPDTTKLGYFVALFNAAATAMRAENQNIKLSHDFIIRRQVMDYWLANGGTEVDTLNFHKYEGWGIIDQTDPDYCQDPELFLQAEAGPFTSSTIGTSYGRTITASQQLYQAQRSRWLPSINSESNVSAAWAQGTEPRIVRISGAVFHALMLRASALNGISYSIWYNMAGSQSYESTKQLDGAGFGMFNMDNIKPWLPYYVYWMLGNNLLLGNQIFSSTDSSEQIRSLVWRNGDVLNIFLINKSHDAVTVTLSGVSGNFTYYKVDESIPYTEATMLTGAVGSSIMLNGYTVALLQQGGESVVLPFHDAFADLSKWNPVNGTWSVS